MSSNKPEDKIFDQFENLFGAPPLLEGEDKSATSVCARRPFATSNPKASSTGSMSKTKWTRSGKNNVSSVPPLHLLMVDCSRR